MDQNYKLFPFAHQLHMALAPDRLENAFAPFHPPHAGLAFSRRRENSPPLTASCVLMMPDGCCWQILAPRSGSVAQ